MRSLLLITLFLLMSPIVRANFDVPANGENPSTKKVEDPLGGFKIESELTSPWTTSARPWLVRGTSLALSLVILEDKISDPLALRFQKGDSLGGYSKYGDLAGRLVPNAAYMIGMLSMYGLSNDPKYLERSIKMLKASAYATAAVTALKYVVREPRPNHANRLSFPSGHSATAFAFASVVASEHDFFPYGAGAMLMAAFTGVSRMNDNQHYLHDVVAGATNGLSFGFGITSLTKVAAPLIRRQNYEAMIVPAISPGYYGLNLQASVP